MQAEVFDSGFEHSHDTYNGIGTGSDGKIYYVLSATPMDVAGRVYVFDPATKKVALVCDLTEACGEKDKRCVAQGKSHVNFVEIDGRLYFSTHIGYYTITNGRETVGVPQNGYNPYAGGHILALDISTQRFEDLCTIPNNEGVLSMNVDTVRRRVYGLTWPSGAFFRYDLQKNDLRVLGIPTGQVEGEAGSEGTTFRTICRSIAVDLSDGCAYFTTSDGTIHKYNCVDDQLNIILNGDNMRKDYFGLYDPASPGHMGYNWRQIIWHPTEKVFYGVHGNSGYLFRFDPRAESIEVIERITSLPSKRSGMFDQFSYGYLGFTLEQHSNTLYYLTGAPIYDDKGNRIAGKNSTAKGEAKGLENLHLITYNISHGLYKDHGPIFYPNGERPLYVNSITLGHDNSVYSLGRVARNSRVEVDLFRLPPV